LDKKAKVCLISCSVLKEEIEQLVKQGDLDVERVFVPKYFHVDYKLLEDHLRQTIKNTLPNFTGKIVLVYGDLCLGPNNEMKNLSQEYGLVKVDALNCTDCLLGGKGRIGEVDPNHELMILHPGMIDFFYALKGKLKKENIDEEVFKNFFSQIKGIILLDTLGQAEKDEKKIEKLNTDLKILETKKAGLNELKQVILEALQRQKIKN
jgi:hypothetical protein